MDQSVTTSWVDNTGTPRSVTTTRNPATETPAAFRDRHIAAVTEAMNQYPPF
jgi:hypothetical protein